MSKLASRSPASPPASTIVPGAEGRKAFAVFKTTQSATAARELRHLREQLAAA